MTNQINAGNFNKLRFEFRFLIDRCECSRAGTFLAPKEAQKFGVKPSPPSCTPSKCFPTLYKILYPKGGLSIISNSCKNSLIRYKMEVNKK